MTAFAAANVSPAYRPPRGSAERLRAWQQAALESYLALSPRDFLTVATPGSGKTTYALRVATELLESRVVERIIVVAPTEHLKAQWSEAAALVGIVLDADFSGARGTTSSDSAGIAVTYAGVAANPLLFRRRVEDRKTLVILDEVHHAGDSMSWGESVREAFEPATRRLALTGTPFRSDVNPIPFVSYVPGPDGIARSAADHVYGYAEALRDRVVRPVMFLAYSGRMRWRTRAGDEVSADLAGDQSKDVTRQAWRTALDPQGEWIPQVLRAADRRLTEVRKHVPDAAGLVIASDQTKARAYARQLEAITGRKPVVVLSDDPKSGERIANFGSSDDRWMVAVRMVSEGVDVPRFMVGVYATSASTPLYFAQAVGRFVRARRRGETASVFLPSVPLLLRLAGELEEQRDHVLGRVYDGMWTEEDALMAAALAQRTTPDLLDDQLSFEALESEATFDRVLFDGGEFGAGVTPGTVEEEDFLGIPGLLDADQVSDLLRSRGSRVKVAAGQPVVTTVDISALKRELGDCVKAYARQMSLSQATIHADLRRICGGPEVPRASAAELRQRVDRVRTWATTPSRRGR